MAGIPRQVIPISFNQGLDTKTDPKQVMPGKLVYLKNAIFKTAKEIRKRFGSNAIPNSILGGGSLSTGVNAAGYMSELTLLDGNNLYSYSASTSDLLNKGALPTTSIATTAITRGNLQLATPDSAINGNIQAFAWRNFTPGTSGGDYYSVIDRTTGQNLVANQLLTVHNSKVKVIALGTYILFFYYNSTTLASLYYKYIDITNPTVLSAEQTLASDLSFAFFDVSVFNNRAYVVYGGTGGKTSIYYLDTSLTRSVQYNLAGDQPTAAVTIFGDASGNAWVCFGKNTNQIYVFVANSSLTATVLAKTLLATPSSQANNITGIVTGTTATIYYDYGPVQNPTSFPSTITNQIDHNTMTLAGTAGTPANLVHGMAIVSKVFVYSGIYYLLTVFPTNEQATYFLLNQNALAVAKFSPGLSGGVNTATLPEVNLVSSGVFQFAALAKEQITAFESINTTGRGSFQTGNQFTSTGVQSLQVTFTLVARPKLVAGQNLLIGGGILSMYDGIKPVEQNFNMYPEGVSNGTPTLSGGGIGVGTSTATINQVQYSVIYEWIDNEGQVHRSSTSIPLAVQLPKISPTASSFTGDATLNSNVITNVTGASSFVVGQVITNANIIAGTTITSISGSNVGISSNAISSATGTSFNTGDLGTIPLVIPTLRLTQKTNVSIIIYRTVNNGTIFYRITSPQTPLLNDPTVDTVSYTDKAPDATIIGNEQLYTTGGEVDNDAPPAVNALVSYRNRALYLSPEYPNAFGYSKQVIPGFPVEFSNNFVQNVDAKGGSLSALAEMDDKIILFKANSIFYVAGEGPTPSGANNDFSSPQFVTADTGCSNQASVVLTPIGVMFQSPKGIYLLGRNLQAQYIGAEVEAYNNQTVTSAQLITTLNQVRFTLGSGVCLTYDYYFQQWSVFEDMNAADSTIFQNQFTFISPTGVISQEDPTIFTNNGAFIPLGLTTTWFSFAGLQGFERCYKLLILGEYESPHTLNVSVGYDFETTVTDIDPIPTLSDPGVYQYRIHMPRQKCEAFQFSIEETQTAPFGEGLSLSGMSLEVGTKVGPNKMPAAKSYG